MLLIVLSGGISKMLKTLKKRNQLNLAWEIADVFYFITSSICIL